MTLHKNRKSLRRYDPIGNLLNYISEDAVYYLEHGEPVMCVWDKLQKYKF